MASRTVRTGRLRGLLRNAGARSSGGALPGARGVLPGVRRAAGRVPGVRTAPASDVQESTLRYLMYGLLPFWFAPGLADWWQHRRTRIEDSPGTRESLIHSLMMAEVGAPIALTLLCEVNPLVLTVQAGATAAHEATALWDVRTAHESEREVRPVEQHIHSFLESLPFSALASLACLHPDQMRSLLHGGRGDRNAWRLVPRREPLPRPYLAGIAAGVGVCILLPYAEELLRCARAQRARKKQGSDAYHDADGTGRETVARDRGFGDERGDG